MSLLDLQGMSFRNGHDSGRSWGGGGVSSVSRQYCNTNSNFSVGIGLCDIEGL